MGPYQVLPVRVGEDLGVMPIEGYSTFPRVPEIEPHRQVQFSYIQDTRFERVTSNAMYSTTPADCVLSLVWFLCLMAYQPL